MYCTAEDKTTTSPARINNNSNRTQDHSRMNSQRRSWRTCRVLEWEEMTRKEYRTIRTCRGDKVQRGTAGGTWTNLGDQEQGLQTYGHPSNPPLSIKVLSCLPMSTRILACPPKVLPCTTRVLPCHTPPRWYYPLNPASPPCMWQPPSPQQKIELSNPPPPPSPTLNEMTPPPRKKTQPETPTMYKLTVPPPLQKAHCALPPPLTHLWTATDLYKIWSNQH